MDEITRLSLELVRNQQIPHTEIFHAIRKKLVDASKDIPNVKVLYSASYGNYCYSKDFQQYLSKTRGDTFCTCRRTGDVQYIESYGRELSTTYPLLFDMIYLYKHYTKVICDLSTLKATQRNLHYFKQNLDSIKSTLHDSSEYGDEIIYNVKEDWWWNTEVDKKRIESFNKETLLVAKDYLTTRIQQCTAKYDNQIALIPISSDIVHRYLQKNYSDGSWRDWRRNPNNMDELMSFIEAVAYYGVDHFAIWHCQPNFKSHAMLFMLEARSIDAKGLAIPDHQTTGMLFDLFKNDGSYIEISEDLANQTYMDLGLLCASDAICDLKIAEIPALLEWQLDEHDGLERVSIA